MMVIRSWSTSFRVRLVGNSDHGTLSTADGASSTLEVASVNSAVGVDGSGQSHVEAGGLTLKVLGAALDVVNDRESDGLGWVSS
jgi:hypothetical protein